MPPLLSHRNDDKEDYIPVLLYQVWEAVVESDPHTTEDLQKLHFETLKDSLSKKVILLPVIIEDDQDLTYEDP